MRPRASLCQSSRHRLLTLLLLVSLGLLCVQTVGGSGASSSASLGNISGFINNSRLIGGTSLNRNYFIISKCRGHVQVTLSRGKFAINALANSSSRFAVLTLESHGIGEFRVWGNVSNKYMCFSRKGRLIARYNGNSKRCRFRGVEGRHYTMLQSAAHRDWYVGFNKRGFSKRSRRRRLDDKGRRGTPSRMKCYQFTLLLIDRADNDPRVQNSLQKESYDPLKNADISKIPILSRKQQRRLRHTRSRNRKNSERNRRLRRLDNR